MRLSLWLILILAFAVGMGCALVIRTLHFEAPQVVQTDEPKTKILVATRTIPGGVEITADFVAFQEVVLSEVPLGALSSFTQVYRRQSAYPIPADCPICEDLLLPLVEIVPQTTFIPAGNQLVSLDIVHIRQGDKVFPPKEPLSAMLNADQRVDIRIIPRNKEQGRLSEMKNEVLRTYAVQNPRSTGELLLENVPIHQIQRRSITNHTGIPKDSLVLMLDKSDAAKLTAAAKKGQIRILAHQSEQTAPQSPEPETIFEVAEQTQPLDIPLDIPDTLEQSLLIPVESVPAVAVEHVQKIAPMPDVFDSTLPSAPMPDADLVPPPIAGIPQSLDRLDNSLVSALTKQEDEEKVLIRNESPMASFGTSPRIIPADRPVEQNSVPTGLPVTNELEHGSLVRPLSEAVMGPPRMSQAIKFLPPGSVTPITEYPPTMASRAESTRTLPAMMPPTTAPPVMPLIVPTPAAPLEKAEIPGYSPWDRRIYTVQPSEGWGDGADGELSPPPRLLRSANATL